MENAFEQIKVLNIQEKVFTDKNTGEQKTYYACTGQTTHNEFFIFNDYESKPDLDSLYGMYLASDKYLKARVIYKRLK